MNDIKKTTQTVAIIDIEMGNITSVRNAVEYLGGRAEVVDTPDRLELCDRIILPGVGSFSEGILQLREKWESSLVHQVKNNKKPFLGICLGMQLLANKGSEGGENSGLGWLDAEVTKLESRDLKLPHIGWNSVSLDCETKMFNNIKDSSDFYFLHSYDLKKINNSKIYSTSFYGQKFISAIELDNVWATQFHPEKSQVVGLQLLRNFMDYSFKGA